jgi:hypothetical protein
MDPPPQSTDGAAAPFELLPPSDEDVLPSGEIGSVGAPPPQSTDGAAAPVELQPPSMVSAGMVKSGETEKSTSSVDMSAGVVKSAGKSNCETEARIKQQSQMDKSAQMEELYRETRELMLRLDPTGSVLVMCVASPLYAVLAALPLWLLADHPQALLWTFAHLNCLYLFLWIIALSTTRISTVFFRITYIIFLAFTVAHLIGPMNGIIFLYTGMIYVAGMLGYAVAEHLQAAGFEQTANVLRSTPFNSKDCEEQVSVMYSCTVLMSSPILARMAWVLLVPYSDHMTRMDVLGVVSELTAEIFILSVLWIVYITEFILKGALVSMERFVYSASICWFACCSLAMVLSFYIAEAVGMLVMWLGWMAIGGFFGYSLAVRACYCKMLTGYYIFLLCS